MKSGPVYITMLQRKDLIIVDPVVTQKDQHFIWIHIISSINTNKPWSNLMK